MKKTKNEGVPLHCFMITNVKIELVLEGLGPNSAPELYWAVKSFEKTPLLRKQNSLENLLSCHGL